MSGGIVNYRLPATDWCTGLPVFPPAVLLRRPITVKDGERIIPSPLIYPNPQHPMTLPKHALAPAGVFFSLAIMASAELTLPSFFSDRMVLQQKTGARVWGKSDPAAQVKVTFPGQSSTTTADANGDWSVTLSGLVASAKGAPLVITSGKDTRTINDVLVGEVWLASGQSNMEWRVAQTTSRGCVATDRDDLLRVYVSGNATSIEPATDFAGSWKTTLPANTGGFTAVGYEFAKALREKLGVPVGIIECAWGGKPVESFISKEAMRSCPEAGLLLDRKAAAVASWQNARSGKEPGQAASRRHPALDPNMPSAIYNGMIAPLAGYGARGAIWYQGESNANPGTATRYGELLECLIQDWRKQWDSPLSFYYVQLANFTRRGRSSPHWVIVQDEMRRLLDDSNSKTGHIGMATINDIGHPTDIHPRNKREVGRRLARWALHRDYGMKDVVVSGPLYKSHTVKGDTIEIRFDHAQGLKTRDGTLPGGFEVAGADGKWQPAEARISGGKITLSSTGLHNPAQARYAWHSNPTDANVVNGEGLPTSCFTTRQP